MTIELNVDEVVGCRYTEGAREQQESLCCPVTYDPRYLRTIPREVIERDYGCGDPTPYLRRGDRVLDLGSGAGKLCFIAAQIVGATGRVIGVDNNAEMLALARRHASEVTANLGFYNVKFRRGKIEDLATNQDAVDAWLAEHPVRGFEDLSRLEDFIAHQRANAPLVGSQSVDVVVSSCVLNLVRDSSKRAVLDEAYRALRSGGRVIVSDIVADEPVPEHLKKDPVLWSGCISGALEQSEFLRAFEEAGFYGVEILKRDEQPWRTIEGVEFRSITVRAMKGKEGPCLDCNQAVIYRGPWRKVEDDDGHVLLRGRQVAVCEKTFRIYTSAPYADQVIPVPPLTPVVPNNPPEVDRPRDSLRKPQETKGRDDRTTNNGAASCCSPGGSGS